MDLCPGSGRIDEWVCTLEPRFGMSLDMHDIRNNTYKLLAKLDSNGTSPGLQYVCADCKARRLMKDISGTFAAAWTVVMTLSRRSLHQVLEAIVRTTRVDETTKRTRKLTVHDAG